MTILDDLNRAVDEHETRWGRLPEIIYISAEDKQALREVYHGTPNCGKEPKFHDVFDILYRPRCRDLVFSLGLPPFEETIEIWTTASFDDDTAEYMFYGHLRPA